MNILIAEDDTPSRMLLVAALSKLGHGVIAVANGEEAWQLCEEQHFPLLISDWSMPKVDGLELCRRIRNKQGNLDAAQYTYVILLTAHSGKANYVNAMDAGADDFLTKPLDICELEMRLRVAGRLLNLHAALRRQASYDALTGLLNRRAISEILEEEVDRSLRDGTSLAILMADLDRFKAINDTYGHAAGDIVLCEAGHRMRQALRTYDKIGRYGGEEFLMILPNCPEAEAMTVADRICSQLRAAPIDTGIPMHVTTSIGIASVGAGSEAGQHTADVLLHDADTALYRAKAKGRDCYEPHVRTSARVPGAASH